MRWLLSMSLLMLAGCAVTQARLDSFVDPSDVRDPAQFRADHDVCKTAGQARFGQLQGYTPKPPLEEALKMMHDTTRQCLQDKGYRTRPTPAQ